MSMHIERISFGNIVISPSMGILDNDCHKFIKGGVDHYNLFEEIEIHNRLLKSEYIIRTFWNVKMYIFRWDSKVNCSDCGQGYDIVFHDTTIDDDDIPEYSIDDDVRYYAILFNRFTGYYPILYERANFMIPRKKELKLLKHTDKKVLI